MQINVDLHIHSRFSGATSSSMTIRNLAESAPKKGIDVLATGDCLHRDWQREIRECKKIDDGTFEMGKTRFILSVEVEDKNRVHHLLYFPSLSQVEEFREKVERYSINLDTDGRPKLRLGGEEIAQLAKDLDILIGPAHAFTPWTALYAYHDSLKECYGDLADYVAFLELGLSADSDYADRISELHRLTFLTNSDSHSPHPVRLAREFNRMEVRDATFEEIRKAILRRGGNRIVLNVGLPPQEGKYNETACIKCYRHYSLKEAISRRWRCVCGGRIKKGVKDRITELSDLEEPKHPDHRPPYLHIIPLSEIISKAIGQGSVFTKKVNDLWENLVTGIGNEVKILVDADIKDIARYSNPAVAEAIELFREGKVRIIPGGGGRYGIIELKPKEDTPITFNHQKSLLDF
ncbi:MAG TPA: TIGR00375 family protein [Thermoplasmatales archaeon]|nr:TIGR00375 family protein [Thermoplasmatales archaeon]HEX17515.1 TIGR00375 family protein [Thermoplasmatales archaeon]